MTIGGVSYFMGDVRQRESALGAVKACMTRYGRLDILVNGAAGNFLAKAGKLSLKGFKTVLEIDTIGTFNMCELFLSTASTVELCGWVYVRCS